MYVRTVKVPSSSGKLNEYVRVVEAYRQGGKVKQRTIADLGRKDLLTALLPQLERVLKGKTKIDGEGQLEEIDVLEASTWGPVLIVRTLFEQLGLWKILHRHLGTSKSVPFADRAFVLIANRLICPTSEHGLARWLESDFVCDRRGRRFVPRWRRRGRVQVHHQQLDAWYRTLDRLMGAKPRIEQALYHRLRDLFSLRPELVLYDITSSYFEGSGPEGLAKHGYSRDGKPQNVQVILGLVMVAGWPIAHHVWAGNRLDQTTVQEVIADLQQRFSFGRLIFVGDRGMVSEANLQTLQKESHGYLVGLRRRRNARLDAWLGMIDESKWIDCPVGITASEKEDSPRTRVQEIATGDRRERVLVIDSDERRAYEQALREQAMRRTRAELERLRERVASGRLVKPEQIGAAAERILGRRHGYRYYAWELREGVFRFFGAPIHLEREKRLEGKYVIATSEPQLDPQEAVAMYKELTEVERSFRHLKDVLAMRPIYHQIEWRVRAHIFVAALALLLLRLLERRLREGGVSLSAPQALQACATIGHVTFKLGPGRHWGISAASPRARQVLKALGITQLKPPPPPTDDPVVM